MKCNKRHFLALCCYFYFPSVWAAAPESYQPAVGVTTTNTLTVLLSLFLVVGLILLLAWLVRYFNQSSLAPNQAMKAVASLSVGTRERVVLVEVGDKQVLIGVAAGRVTPIHVFDEKVIDQLASNTGDFSKKLKQLLQSNTDGKSAESSN